MKKLLIASMLVASSTAFAGMIEGDLTGGGQVYNTVDTDNGWIANTPASNGVDFWTITVNAGDMVSFSVTSEIDFGMSLYKGSVSDDVGFSFLNNADFTDSISFENGQYIVGTNGLFGEVGSELLNIEITEAGIYTLALGGDLGFGSYGPFNYTLDVEVTEVPVPAAAWLFVSALAGLAGFRKSAK